MKRKKIIGYFFYKEITDPVSSRTITIYSQKGSLNSYLLVPDWGSPFEVNDSNPEKVALSLFSKLHKQSYKT